MSTTSPCLKCAPNVVSSGISVFLMKSVQHSRDAKVKVGLRCFPADVSKLTTQAPNRESCGYIPVAVRCVHIQVTLTFCQCQTVNPLHARPTHIEPFKSTECESGVSLPSLHCDYSASFASLALWAGQAFLAACPPSPNYTPLLRPAPPRSATPPHPAPLRPTLHRHAPRHSVLPPCPAPPYPAPPRSTPPPAACPPAS